MYLKTIQNYIHLFRFSLDKNKLIDSSEKIYELVKNNLHTNQQIKSTISTDLYEKYNYLMYPSNEVHKLYTEIKTAFDSVKDDPNKKYYIQCWLNYYNKGDFIDWHSHWEKEKETWHGFYCLDCEPSFTSYKLPNIKDNINIFSEDNLMVISKSDGDEHRTWPWESDKPRLTIAFDIVPYEYLNYKQWTNHWMPI